MKTFPPSHFQKKKNPIVTIRLMHVHVKSRTVYIYVKLCMMFAINNQGLIENNLFVITRLRLTPLIRLLSDREIKQYNSLHLILSLVPIFEGTFILGNGASQF